jgi:uncharacterized protein with von Willebrand factor type A (vWA) domain
LNKKREAEVHKLRKDLEELTFSKRLLLTNLEEEASRCHSEMTEQIDQLNKMKSKIEKDKHQIGMELMMFVQQMEEVNRAKASAEKNNKNLTNQLNDLNKKVEESNLTLWLTLKMERESLLLKIRSSQDSFKI